MTNIRPMACGVPVVCTRGGLIPQCVPDAGDVLAPERDSEVLAEAIVQLLCNESLRRKMGQVGRAYVIDHCDARKNVERAEEIILEHCPGL